MNRVRHLRDQRGLTLVELLMTTAIIGVVMAGIFVLQRGGQQAYLFGSNRVETQQKARGALDIMTSELRQAVSITTLGGATDITFVWLDESDNPHTIRYALSGTTLNRTYDGNTTPVIGGVHTFSMTYYSVYDVSTGTYTQTTNAKQVKVVKISVRTKTEETVAAGSAGDAQALMESTITLRSTL
jgi:prepilin-type N-terminal cleavage/methylation domain-containing protein